MRIVHYLVTPCQTNGFTELSLHSEDVTGMTAPTTLRGRWLERRYMSRIRGCTYGSVEGWGISLTLDLFAEEGDEQSDSV
jgi:hypothetical protein